MNQIKENLKYLREDKKLSISDVATALGMSPRAYYYYEEGINKPPYEVLHKLCKLYKTTATEILGF